jgi:hypothetical protein
MRRTRHRDTPNLAGKSNATTEPLRRGATVPLAMRRAFAEAWRNR